MTDDYQYSSEELAAAARKLLQEPAIRWSSLAGLIEIWDDDAWLDEGRKRYHAAAPMETDTDPMISAFKYSFSVTQEPWRVRMQLMGHTVADTLQSPPELIVCRGQTWWAKTGLQVITNEARENSRLGLFGLDLMVAPAQLAGTIDIRQAKRVTPGRRKAILLSASASEMIWQHVPELVVLSASRYELEVDEDLGILLATRAYIDNRIARSMVLHDLQVDQNQYGDEEFNIPTR